MLRLLRFFTNAVIISRERHTFEIYRGKTSLEDLILFFNKFMFVTYSVDENSLIIQFTIASNKETTERLRNELAEFDILVKGKKLYLTRSAKRAIRLLNQSITSSLEKIKQLENDKLIELLEKATNYKKLFIEHPEITKRVMEEWVGEKGDFIRVWPDGDLTVHGFICSLEEQVEIAKRVKKLLDVPPIYDYNFYRSF